jgi:hypothetical protein
MKNLILTQYMADVNQPLVVSFSNFLAENGISTVMNYDFWDLLGFGESDGPVIAVLVRKYKLKATELLRLAEKVAPLKVVMLEGDEFSINDFDTMKLFCASLGVSVYIRNLGWVVSGNKALMERNEDWHFKVSPHYSQDEHGNWGKVCRTCERWLPTWAYYVKPPIQKNARDPYRNICKGCFKLGWKKMKKRKT